MPRTTKPAVEPTVEPAVVSLPEKATPISPAPAIALPSVMGATFAERAAARADAVRPSRAENKAVAPE